MADAASLTTEQRDQFNRNHSSQLNSKHQTTIKNIQDLQDIEKYMFNNLQALNKSSPDSVQESQAIQSRLDELSSMRLALFGQLKTMYTDTQRQTADNRSNLADQITMTKVVENELQNAKNQLKVLKQEKRNKKRLVELGEYEYDRYTSHKNIFKIIAYGSLGVLIIVLLMTQPWFPASVGVGSICLIIAIVTITITKRILTNWSRTNLYWNKFQWKNGCTKTNDAGECVGGGSGRKSWNWNDMFQGACDNISTEFSKAKDKLIGIKEQAKTKLEISEESSGEGFSNMVYPTQPKGHEAFHSIF